MTGATKPHLLQPRPLHDKPEVSDHELLRMIGFGSYGEVWLARNVMGVYRAVKVIYRDTFETQRPFEREFEGIRRFEPVSRAHESQVAVLHIGRNDTAGYFYYVMELADDANDRSEAPPEAVVCDVDRYAPKTLRSLLGGKSRLPVCECLELSLSITTALEHLHSHGLVHRDIKPTNIIVVGNRPKLADIGLVAEPDAALSFVGTEGFVPPEGPGQPPADVYSLGKTLYELVTGKDRAQFPEPPTAILDDEDRALFVEFNEILLKACDPDPGRRYRTAGEMRQELLLLQAGKSVRRSRMLESRLDHLKRAAAGLLIVAGVAVAGYFYQQAQTEEARRQALDKQALARSERDQRQLAESAEAQQAFQRVEQMMETGETRRGIAQLAYRLRRHPGDSFAATRLLSALTYRDFALPLIELKHESLIMDGAASPDGQWLVSATAEGDVMFWDLTTGERIATHHAGEFETPTRYVPRFYALSRMNVAFSQDGSRVVAPGGLTRGARVWTLAGTPQLILDIPHPGRGEMAHASFSPDGRRVVAMSDLGNAYIWDAETGERLATLAMSLTMAQNVVWCRYSPDGTRVLTLACRFGRLTEKTIAVWDPQTGRKVNQYDTDDTLGMGMFRQWKEPISWEPRGSSLTYIRGSGRARVWDYESGDVFTSPESHHAPIASVAYRPDARMIATGSNDQTVRLWEVGSDIRSRRVLKQPGFIISLAFSPNGCLLASGSFDGTFQLWDPDSGEPIGMPNLHPGPVRHLQFTPDGKRLISFTDESAWIWDVRPGAALPNMIPHDAQGDVPAHVRSVRFLPDGRHLLTSLSSFIDGGYHGVPLGGLGVADNRVYAEVWDARSGVPVSQPMQSVNSLGHMTVSADGSRALSWTERGTLLWNPQEGVEIREIPMDRSPSRFVLSPDGKWALMIDEEGRGTVWDSTDGRRVWACDDQGPILTGAFDPDSKRLLTITANRQLWIQGAATGGYILSRDESRDLPSNVWRTRAAHGTWSPDGRLIALVYATHCRLYSASGGEPISDWLVHQDVILASSFSRDGRFFVTASADQTAKIWEVNARRQSAPDLRHHWLVDTAVFSPNGSKVATGSWDTTARIWDRATGLALTDPLLHPDLVTCADFHPSGPWLATGCTDGFARIWELPRAPGPAPPWLPELAESLCGYHRTESGSLDPVPSAHQLMVLRHRLSAATSANEDAYRQWAQWFFSDRDSRMISPSSEISIRDGRRRLASMNTVSLTWAERILTRHLPDDPRVFARLAHKEVSNEVKEWIPDTARAEWYSQLAVRLGPNLASSWWTRADVLNTLGKAKEARQAIQKAMHLDPSDPNTWMVQAQILYREGREPQAIESFKKALQLTQSLPYSRGEPDDLYVDPLLRMMASGDVRDVDRMAAWAAAASRPAASDRLRLFVEWLRSPVEDHLSAETHVP